MGNLEKMIAKLNDDEPDIAAEKELKGWEIKEKHNGSIDIPDYFIQLFREYKNAGGESDSIITFLHDIAGFLESGKIIGEEIAEWCKNNK